VFRGVVGGGSGEDAGGGDGEIVDDGAAARDEAERGLRDEECAIEVGGEYILPDWVREFVYCQVGVGDAGVVDHDVESVEFAADGAEEVVYGVRVADVAGMSEDTDFLTRQFPAQFLQVFLVAAGQDQIAAFFSEGARDGETDAATGASDEGSFGFQFELGHGP